MHNKLSLLLLVAAVTLAGCSQETADNQSASSDITKPAKAASESESSAIYEEGVHYRIVKDIDSEGAKQPFLVEYF